MFKKLDKKGFTIIEVLIVLAIVGLIMLVVFLAVPALRRNSSNTARTSDANLLISNINECLTNKNGVVSSCDTVAELQSAGVYDAAKFSQLTDVSFAASLTAAAPAESMRASFAKKCNATADDFDTTAGSARQFAVVFEVESASGGAVLRCVSS